MSALKPLSRPVLEAVDKVIDDAKFHERQARELRDEAGRTDDGSAKTEFQQKALASAKASLALLESAKKILSQ